VIHGRLVTTATSNVKVFYCGATWRRLSMAACPSVRRSVCVYPCVCVCVCVSAVHGIAALLSADSFGVLVLTTTSGPGCATVTARALHESRTAQAFSEWVPRNSRNGPCVYKFRCVSPLETLGWEHWLFTRLANINSRINRYCWNVKAFTAQEGSNVVAEHISSDGVHWYLILHIQPLE